MYHQCVAAQPPHCGRSTKANPHEDSHHYFTSKRFPPPNVGLQFVARKPKTPCPVGLSALLKICDREKSPRTPSRHHELSPPPSYLYLSSAHRFSHHQAKMHSPSLPRHLTRGPHSPSTCRFLAALDARPSTLSPPKLAPAALTADADPSLRSTWAHRAWVAAGSAAVLAPLAKSAAGAAESGDLVQPVAAALLGYFLADLGTGVYHWAIDNYGGPATPVFGPQIESFQGHHRRPWTIARRGAANNLHALARAVALVVVPLDAAVSAAAEDPSAAAVHAFVGVCAGCIMLSQQFHAWAHMGRRRAPAWVAALQGAGLLISGERHGAHHRPPYNNNYCIVSGAWNWVLDEYRVFEVAEMVIFFRFGVRPRSWGETEADWREEDFPQGRELEAVSQ